MSGNIKHEIGVRQAKIIEIAAENQRKKHTINLSPRSSTNVKTLLIPHPMGKINATKNNKSPTPRTQKGAKTLTNPHQCPILPRGGGFN